MASVILVTSRTSGRIGPQRFIPSCGGCRFNTEGISLRLPTKSKMCQHNFSLASADQRKYLKTSPRSEGQRESPTLMCSGVPFFPLMVLAYLCMSSSTWAVDAPKGNAAVKPFNNNKARWSRSLDFSLGHSKPQEHCSSIVPQARTPAPPSVCTSQLKENTYMLAVEHVYKKNKHVSEWTWNTSDKVLILVDISKHPYFKCVAMLLLPSTSVSDLLICYITYFPKSLLWVFWSCLCCYGDIACHLKYKTGTCQISLSMSSPHCFNWNCNCKRVVDFCWHMVHPNPMWAQLDTHTCTHAHLSLLSGDVLGASVNHQLPKSPRVMPSRCVLGARPAALARGTQVGSAVAGWTSS